MTLKVHNLIEQLTRPTNKIMLPPVAIDLPGMAKLYADAEKFIFENIPLELNPEPPDGVRTYSAPQLSDDEISFWRTKSIPLPAPSVCYEYSFDDVHFFVLIRDTDRGWDIVWFEQDKLGDICSLLIAPRALYKVPEDDDVLVAVEVVLPESMSQAAQANPEYSRRFQQTAYGIVHIAIYLTLMLSSKSTERTKEIPPPKLLKKRAANGRTPLYAHTIVNITPDRFLDRGESQGGTHASPRLHWRRSHLRRYENGRHVVIPRCLVGRADLGEVTHEYHVSPRRSGVSNRQQSVETFPMGGSGSDPGDCA